MSFKFNWDSFNDDNFYERVRTLLTEALNKGNKPAILSDRIVVRELYLGEESPQLEILEVGDLAEDRFRGIFKLTYDGDASITLATKVQVNPLKVYSMGAPQFAAPKFLGASAALDIPLNLTLSDIRLSGIIILVFSKAKGLTLVFRNDPLQSVRVSSTFDALPGIARFLQVQIENQIRSLFREELPAILHRLSHRWTPNSGLVLHKNVLERDSDTTDGTDMAKVLFMDINPDMPVLSPSNMKKIEALSSNQRTFSLYTPSIPETMCRANPELLEADNGGWNTYQSLAEEGGNDLAEIARIQSRNYFRSGHAQIKPKRRVIRLTKTSDKVERFAKPEKLENSKKTDAFVVQEPLLIPSVQTPMLPMLVPHIDARNSASNDWMSKEMPETIELLVQTSKSLGKKGSAAGYYKRKGEGVNSEQLAAPPPAYVA